MDSVDKILTSLEKNRILTKTAQLGLLSKLDKAGVKLSTVAPLLIKADELDLLGLLAASSDKILPLAVTAIVRFASSSENKFRCSGRRPGRSSTTRYGCLPATWRTVNEGLSAIAVPYGSDQPRRTS